MSEHLPINDGSVEDGIDYPFFNAEDHARYFEQLLRPGPGHHVIDAQADSLNPTALSVILEGPYSQWRWAFNGENQLTLQRQNTEDSVVLLHVERLHFDDQSITTDWLRQQQPHRHRA